MNSNEIGPVTGLMLWVGIFTCAGMTYLNKQLGTTGCIVVGIGIIAIIVSLVKAIKEPRAVALFWTSPFWLPSWLAARISLFLFTSYPLRWLAIQVNRVELLIFVWRIPVAIIIGWLWFLGNLIFFGSFEVFPPLIALIFSLYTAGLCVYLYFDLLVTLPRRGVTWIPFSATETLQQQDRQIKEVLKTLKHLPPRR